MSGNRLYSGHSNSITSDIYINVSLGSRVYNPICCAISFPCRGSYIKYSSLLLIYESMQCTVNCFIIHTCRWSIARCGYIGYCLCVFVCVCVCTVTDFSAEDIAVAASNFSRLFIGVRGRESHIFVNFAPTEAQNRTNRPALLARRAVLPWSYN